MTTSFKINRTFAVTAVNIYYELKKEGNNREDERQFEKNFVKFIVPYMDNTYFTGEIAKCLFISIATLEDEKEEYCPTNVWKCKYHSSFSYREVDYLFLSVKNYHYLHRLKNRHFEPIKKAMDIIAKEDWVIEENDCCICKKHGYDIDWPNSAERGKFYYSIPGNINRPVCESCVDIKNPDSDSDTIAVNAVAVNSVAVNAVSDDEIYGSDSYLRKYHLVKCENCGNIWDGYAQCNCWQYSDYSDSVNWKEFTLEKVPAPLSMDKKIKVLEEKIALLEEQYKNLVEAVSKLK